MRRILRVLMMTMMIVFLAGCGSGTETGESPESHSGPYQAPEFLDSGFHEDQAQGVDGAQIDLSAVDEGYVGVSVRSDTRLKCQVLKDDITYNYDIASDGAPSILPLQSGNGSYRIRIMENVGENKYAELYATSCVVSMEDEFQPFLRPNDYVNYTRNSQCVKKAEELAGNAGDALGLIENVYSFVCDTVTYDTNKAETVKSGYLPDPDETMATGKGICFDYASLTAAMLRSQGIPTKVIFGYVSPDNLYHAWNMFYTDETGWVTVSYEVKGDTWNRLDMTFSANGADSEFIGDGSNYSDLYFY